MRQAARPFAACLALTAIALALPAAAFAPPAGAHVAGGSATGKATVDGLTVTLTAVPARVSQRTTVHFVARARTGHATGALGYRLTYGDGTSAPPVAIPEFCLADPGRPAQESWRFTHRYPSPGRYRARLDVYVNCGGEQATVGVTVIVLS